MSSIELFPFQSTASEMIARRFAQLWADDGRPYEKKYWATPYYQALSALTGAGKTPILADAVTQMRAIVSGEPIVLWISKAKAVVDQTYANFQPGGKYAHLIDVFLVDYLSNLTPQIVSQVRSPYIALATVGTFNQKDKGDGTLRVHKTDQDTADEPLWTLLRERKTSTGERRPLIIVYDEGHNLSNQQTDLLLELEPDAILVSSATMKTPGALGRIIDRLKDYGWDDDTLVTSVPSKKVVDEGLVKRQIILGGYSTNMESVLNDMLLAMEETTRKAEALEAGFMPKAIYVCRTNISQDDGTLDNISRPFYERKAPPILIWRYLVEEKNIDPDDIAVYADLNFDMRDNPPPDDFILFSGGEEDFASFTAGDYHHIIFNLSLQEGWDDPACCFAYIDKSMGSAIQVEQVIGRVLRQPHAHHFPDPDLNTANFYIRVDDKQIFPQIMDTVRRKIAAEVPEVRLEGYTNIREKQRLREEPKDTVTLPQIHIESSEAAPLLAEALEQIQDFRSDAAGNTIGRGNIEKAIQNIGDGSKPIVNVEDRPHSNPVMARWILRRSIQALYPNTVQSVDTSNQKFDARVEINSRAAEYLRGEALKLVEIYLENSDLVFEEENPYIVGPVIVNPGKVISFTNALHKGYSDLSDSELPFAQAIDATGYQWVRNPTNGGYSIPLLEIGDSRRFFPDFLVWKDDVVFAIDPKGDHLIATAAGMKLLNIRDENNKERIVVRLITQGKWKDLQTKTQGGYTVWQLDKTGKPKPRSYPTIAKAIDAALKLK